MAITTNDRPSRLGHLRGIPVAPGIAIGQAFVLDRPDPEIHELPLLAEEVEVEVLRFKRAIEKARLDLQTIHRRVAMEVGEDHARVFEAHLWLLQDPMIIDETIQHIRKEHKNAAYLFQKTITKAIAYFHTISDPYFKERAVDIQDVSRRVIHHLLGEQMLNLANLDSPVIVVAHELTPSETAEMDRQNALGFITEIGGRTSHTAIMARALEVPAVVGTAAATRHIRHGDLVILDGFKGHIYPNPDAALVQLFEYKQERFLDSERNLLELKDYPAITTDGRIIELSANIELPREVDSVLSHGADGIGLYRTEFLYLLLQSALPTEEQQYRAYRSILKKMAPRPVVMRTLDLGGDKLHTQLNPSIEVNPALGWRSIRLCLGHKDIFKVQLRAMLRASTVGNLKIMFPMISRLDELREALAVLQEVKDDLYREGTEYDPTVKVGVMIEIPSAALIADHLASEVDFFSIGTNDLMQYLMAADRTNEKVAYLFDLFNPALLRTITRVIEAGHKQGIWVGMCGEMSGDPSTTLLLVGLELDELSMSPLAIPQIKKVIRSISYEETRMIARQALQMSSAVQIKEYVLQQLTARCPEIILEEKADVPA